MMSTMQTLVRPFLSWDVSSFLKNSEKQLKDWGGGIILIIGVVMIIASVWQIASGLMSHGKKQTNWAIALLLLIVGGAFVAGGWGFVSNIASGGKKTIEDLGSGSIVIPNWIPKRPF